MTERRCKMSTMPLSESGSEARQWFGLSQEADAFDKALI
jgi:hypothetical protein